MLVRDLDCKTVTAHQDSSALLAFVYFVNVSDKFNVSRSVFKFKDLGVKFGKLLVIFVESMLFYSVREIIVYKFLVSVA